MFKIFLYNKHNFYTKIPYTLAIDKKKGVLAMYDEYDKTNQSGSANGMDGENKENQDIRPLDGVYRNVYYSDQENTGYTGQNQYQNEGSPNYGSGWQDYYGTAQTTDKSGSGKKEKKKGRLKKGVAFAVKAAAFGLIAGAAFYGINQAAEFIYPIHQAAGSSVKLPVTVTTSAGGNSSPVTAITDVSDIVAEVMPSVVSVISRVSNEVTYGPFSLGKQEYDASGSGIIVGQSDTELLIATNNHVIEDAESIMITFTDNTPENLADDVSVAGLVKGTRADNDLAVVAVKLTDIPDEVLSYIKIASLGDSDNLSVGEGTIAIGNSLGYGQSVTTGCVSALNREVTIDNLRLNMIQTDAAINSGNSGGALLNMKGEVIGINSAKYSSSGVEGMGYAIPISSVMDIINELMNRQTRTIVDESERGYLGVEGINITKDYSQAYGAPMGFSIQEIVPGGAAEAAGLQKYDIIVRLDGQSVNSYEELKDLLQYYKAGETIPVVVKYIENHEYVEREVQLTLQKADAK